MLGFGGVVVFPGSFLTLMGLLRSGCLYLSHKRAEMDMKTKSASEKDTQLMSTSVSEVVSIHSVMKHWGGKGRRSVEVVSQRC